MIFKIVYEPKIEDPVVIAKFKIQYEAEEYMKQLREKKPQTYKHTTIVVESNKKCVE